MHPRLMPSAAPYPSRYLVSESPRVRWPPSPMTRAVAVGAGGGDVRMDVPATLRPRHEMLGSASEAGESRGLQAVAGYLDRGGKPHQDVAVAAPATLALEGLAAEDLDSCRIEDSVEAYVGGKSRAGQELAGRRWPCRNADA